MILPVMRNVLGRDLEGDLVLEAPSDAGPEDEGIAVLLGGAGFWAAVLAACWWLVGAAPDHMRSLFATATAQMIMTATPAICTRMIGSGLALRPRA